ncbi:hypothetical protein CANMA_004273 [Candida margitis]|uniref:uncharacterized protein n=1 Tax=Candida margitis TaxID=1775924 RepID=UPI0022270F27|nr:uncharacterized protein CANMA_004273 [Candida margitis]KAI5958429.1 hypothetical protein CANMA_004273 [Candida margitis]
MFHTIKRQFTVIRNPVVTRLLHRTNTNTNLTSTLAYTTARNLSFKIPNVFKAVQQANKIDERFDELGKSPTENKVQQVIDAVKDTPELLFQLNFFFYECKKLGITHDNVGQRKRHWKYWPSMILKLIPLNSALWDTCYSLDKAQHQHRLTPFKINDIGLLDPKNFPPDFIQQLATGKYNGIDFRNVIIFAFSRPKFTNTTTTDATTNNHKPRSN